MTGSRVSGLLVFLLVSLIGFGTPAMAQSDVGAPVQLPGAGEEESDSDSGDEASQRVPARPGARDLGIEVGVISSRAPTVGTLSGSDGLGTDIWSGTSITKAQILLNQIPVKAPSRAMANLVRRLLLTASRPPEDERGGDAIIELRIERALDAGLIDAVPTMLDQATPLAGDPEAQILRAEIILLRGGGMEACTNATAQRLELEEPFWMKLRAFCFAQQGRIPAARLTADLLYENGDDDELFQALLERMTGNTAVDLDDLMDRPLSRMHLAMMREINVVPQPARMEEQSLSVYRVMALDPGWNGDEGLAFRLHSAERAAFAGVLASSQLLEVYQAVAPFEPERRTEQLTAAARTNEPNSRALFAEALTADKIPGTRAETLAAALAPAAGTEAGPTYAAVLGHAVRDMRPEEVLAWAAHEFALASLADGDLAQAYDWFDIFSYASEPSAQSLQSLRAALTMAAPSERFAFWPEHALSWLEEADLRNISHARLAAQLMWFGAMGYSIPEEVRERLSASEGELTGYMPPPAVLANLREAAQAGRVGETVAYALVAIGRGGPREAHPRALAEAITALRDIGLGGDGRALAAEALLGIALEDVE